MKSAAQQKKLSKSAIKSNISVEDPTKVIFNFSKYELSDCEKLDFLKTRTKEAALSSHRTYNNNVPQHLSKEKSLALQNLSRNKDIVIQNLMKVILL